MFKVIKWGVVGLAVLAILGYAGFEVMKMRTKKASPEEVATFVLDAVTVEVNYSRPYKKARQIFGGLVPYGKVWRTGANEATTFTVNSDIQFNGTPVPSGTYTLWTIPGKEEWSVILNGKMYGWGVNFEGEAQRDPLADVALAKVPVRHLEVPMEQFTIAVSADPSELTLTWDDVQVGVPIVF